jgi:tetrahydromethanopterin S-methyltransferase subunit G
VTGTVVDPPEFVRRIGDRIEDIERELERRQAELEDLRTALAVFENLTSGGRR